MMKASSILKALAAVAAGVLLFSCTKPKVTELSLSGMAANFEASGSAAVTINVTSNEAWTVSKNADWVTVSPTSGSGNGSFTISAQDNTGIDTRSTTVTVTAQDKSASVSVSQLGITPQLLITGDPSGKHMGHEGGTSVLEIKANVPWTATVVDSPDWVTVSPTSGNGNASVSVTFAPNVLRQERKVTIEFRESVGGTTKSAKLYQEMGPATRMTDSLALVAVFNATGGAANWKEERCWDLTKPMNEWYGVKLNEEGRVTQMDFKKETITAEWSLPKDVGELTEMTNFRIIGCNLTGAIPDEIYNMTKLVSFYLTNNTPTWSLSAKIADMTDLKDLYIDQNANFSGTLPKELGTLTKLVNINVSQTRVSGEVPAELKGCSSLNNLMGFKTQLSGIPDNFDEWPSLKLIQLYGNPNLTGELPASIGRCTKLTSVWLYECNFTGNIPESWSGLPSTCIQLRIQDNKLSGIVPAAIQAHANWTKWNAAKYILSQQEGFGLTLE